MSPASLTTLAVRRCDAEAAGAMPAPDVATLSQVTRPSRTASAPGWSATVRTSVATHGCALFGTLVSRFRR